KRRRRHRWLATRGEAPSPEAPPPPPVFACSVAPRVSLAKEIWFLQIHHLPRGEYHNSWSSHIVHLVLLPDSWDLTLCLSPIKLLTNAKVTFCATCSGTYLEVIKSMMLHLRINHVAAVLTISQD
ncbi:Os05g0116500, partial [Oryza sativa Japonica Group]